MGKRRPSAAPPPASPLMLPECIHDLRRAADELYRVALDAPDLDAGAAAFEAWVDSLFVAYGTSPCRESGVVGRLSTFTSPAASLLGFLPKHFDCMPQLAMSARAQHEGNCGAWRQALQARALLLVRWVHEQIHAFEEATLPRLAFLEKRPRGAERWLVEQAAAGRMVKLRSAVADLLKDLASDGEAQAGRREHAELLKEVPELRRFVRAVSYPTENSGLYRLSEALRGRIRAIL